jgi:hypothetical protein
LAFLFFIPDGRAASGFARFAFFIVTPLLRRPPDFITHSFLQENEGGFPGTFLPIDAASGDNHCRASEKATLRNRLDCCV